MKKHPKKKVFLLSDSTGELGERFVNALSTQFPTENIELVRFNFVQKKDLEKIFQKVSLSRPSGVLFHTVISESLKKSIDEFSRRAHIPGFDLTGPPTHFLIKNLKVKPDWNVQTLHPIDASYQKRIESIEFTINHDDGAGLSTLSKAEVILLGPSRVSKTPTSMFLAMKAIKTANIPLIRDIGEPKELAKLKGDPRVWGLLINPDKLRQVREKRAIEMGSEPQSYLGAREICREIGWVAELYKKYGWRTIDVTDRAIEETASIILRALRKV